MAQWFSGFNDTRSISTDVLGTKPFDVVPSFSWVKLSKTEKQSQEVFLKFLQYSQENTFVRVFF